MNKIIMITGANSGIGKESARQLALQGSTKKIYMACRSRNKAEEAKKSLEQSTGKMVFGILIMDVSKPESVKKAVASLNESIDALIMNAGGMGGKTPFEKTKDGVTSLFAANLLGHTVLVDELMKAKKLNNVALYAGSEGARGVKKMGMKPPVLKESSVDEFKTVIDGSYFSAKKDSMEYYTYVKYMAALWMSSLSRQYPKVKFVTMSPGATKGTGVMDDLPAIKRFMFKYFGFSIVMPLMGMVHKVEKGAARFVDGISNAIYKSGTFYASKQNVLTGPVVDQSSMMADLTNQKVQDNADAAIHAFIN